MTALLVFLGAGLGGVTRYAVGRAMPSSGATVRALPSFDPPRKRA